MNVSLHGRIIVWVLVTAGSRTAGFGAASFGAAAIDQVVVYAVCASTDMADIASKDVRRHIVTAVTASVRTLDPGETLSCMNLTSLYTLALLGYSIAVFVVHNRLAPGII